MKLPNFLAIGAAKSGTSALDEYLRQHPDVFLNPMRKELRFFAYDGHPPNYRGPGDVESNRLTTTSLSAYAEYFAGATRETAVGEVSPVYLYSERAPACIQHYIPAAKLIAILRHPVDRAHSHFLHLVRDRREPFRDFTRALAEEDARVRDNWEWSWHYRRVGRYAEQLQRYLERFDRRQIRIYLYEDFQADAVAVCRDIFGFLGVDDGFVPDTSKRYNESKLPRSRAVTRMLLAAAHALQPMKSLAPTAWWRRASVTWRGLYESTQVKPALALELRRQLTRDYRDEIQRLEVLIDRDLSRWLT